MKEQWKFKGVRRWGRLTFYMWHGPIDYWDWSPRYGRLVPRRKVWVVEYHMYRLKMLGAGSE